MEVIWLMKCSNYRKLIHRMLDGDLNRQEKRRVCAHLDECEDCRSYCRDMAAIGAHLREADVKPPPEFRQNWKQQLAALQNPAAADPAPARPRKKKLRPAVLVPVVACCAAMMFVVSTIIVNPQAFGLEGLNVSGQWFAAVVPEATPEPAPSIDQGSGQKVSFVATREKKPNQLDLENSDYSETTTVGSQAPQLSAEGTIEPHVNELYSAVQEAYEAGSTALPEEEPLLTLSVTHEECERLRELAEEMALSILLENESGVLIEGTPLQIEELADGYSLEIPEDAPMVRLQVQ